MALAIPEQESAETPVTPVSNTDAAKTPGHLVRLTDEPTAESSVSLILNSDIYLAQFQPNVDLDYVVAIVLARSGSIQNHPDKTYNRRQLRNGGRIIIINRRGDAGRKARRAAKLAIQTTQHQKDKTSYLDCVKLVSCILGPRI